ncbi:hypothetical protein D3C74_227600 [compost metagenome]
MATQRCNETKTECATNKGGAAPKGNDNAVTHGLFQKYLPAESLEIMEQPIDWAPELPLKADGFTTN